jgi:hypothetical protein
MERVAFLIQETNQRLGCLLNPESMVMRRVAGVQPRRSTTGPLTGAGLSDDPLLFTGGGRTELDLDLLFDVSLAGSSIRAEDVRELTAPLWDLAENAQRQQGYGQPPLVRLIWGKSWNIPGIVVAVAERLEYFTAAGIPQRSWLRMRMLRVNEPPAGRARPHAPPATALPLLGEIPEDMVTVHRPIGGSPPIAEGEGPGAAALAGADDILSSVLDGTPAGSMLASARAAVASALDVLGTEVEAWAGEEGEAPAAQSVRSEVEAMSASAAAVDAAPRTQVVEASTSAAGAVLAGIEAISEALAGVTSAAGQEVARRIKGVLAKAAPAAREMAQAAVAIAEAVRARAATIIARSVERMDTAVAWVDSALSRVAAGVPALGAQAIAAIRSAAGTIGAALEEIRSTGEMAAVEKVPAALQAMGAALGHLWSIGERGAARAIHLAIETTSTALQRAVAAAGAIRSVLKSKVTPLIGESVAAIRSALAADAAPAGDQDAAGVVRAAVRKIGSLVDALRPGEGVPEALGAIRSVLGAFGPGGGEAARQEARQAVEKALGAITAAVEGIEAAEKADAAALIASASAGPAAARPQEEGGDGRGEPLGERLDQIAFRYYGEPALWRLLATFNDISDPFCLSPGRPLRIPPLSVLRSR